MSDSSAPADDAPRIHTGFTSNTQGWLAGWHKPQLLSLNNLSNSVSEKRACSKNKEITPSLKQKCWVSTCFPLNSCHCAQSLLAGALPNPFVECTQDSASMRSQVSTWHSAFQGHLPSFKTWHQGSVQEQLPKAQGQV